MKKTSRSRAQKRLRHSQPLLSILDPPSVFAGVGLGIDKLPTTLRPEKNRAENFPAGLG